MGCKKRIYFKQRYTNKNKICKDGLVCKPVKDDFDYGFTSYNSSIYRCQKRNDFINFNNDLDEISPLKPLGNLKDNNENIAELRPLRVESLKPLGSLKDQNLKNVLKKKKYSHRYKRNSGYKQNK